MAVPAGLKLLLPVGTVYPLVMLALLPLLLVARTTCTLAMPLYPLALDPNLVTSPRMGLKLLPRIAPPWEKCWLDRYIKFGCLISYLFILVIKNLIFITNLNKN